MSKIPQGEWNAIAARYQNGESISKIARSYGCTPPAIHYILKRNGQRPTTITPQPTPMYPTEAARAGLVRANAAEPPAAMSVSEKVVGDTANSGVHPKSAAPALTPRGENFVRSATAPVSVAVNSPGSPLGTRFPPLPAREPTAPAPVSQIVRDPARMPDPRIATVGSAAFPGLDSELHLRAEAAIESFRSSFDAALAEGSSDVRARLRQAATNLMRVAARTTMVLDRINATGDASARNHNYPRSPRLRDELETNGFK